MQIPALLLTSQFDKITRGLFDNTFTGIHQLRWFDWAILVPYFGLLAILSVYGLHRFEMIRAYFKHRKNAVSTPRSDSRRCCRSPFSFLFITNATFLSG